MSKSYVLDTNVLMQDPDAIFNFKENDVIIPIGVIEELDRAKKKNDEIGRNARQVSRYIDELSIKNDITKGVKLSGGGKLFVISDNNGGIKNQENVDFHIIRVAQELVSKNKSKKQIVIVTRDTNVRIKARSLALVAEDYNSNKVDEVDTGFDELIVPDSLIGEFELDNELENEIFDKYKPNHYFCLKSDSSKVSSLGRLYCEKGSNRKVLRKLLTMPGEIGIKPKNREQSFVMDALLDKDIKLVCISGRAGTGKTILGAAVGWHMVDRMKFYDRLLVSRPVVPMGNDIGFLPGTVNEKLDPWMAPIYDAFDVILGQNKKKKSFDGKNHVLMNESVRIEPLTYIRGRSIHNQFFLLDESQNITALEAKTIITRAGENTKIVMTGDIDQIDNPYVDKYSNGLSVVMEAFKTSTIAAHVMMSKGVRSDLAEEATYRL